MSDASMPAPEPAPAASTTPTPISGSKVRAVQELAAVLDLRWLVVAGLFGLSWRIFAMVESHPDLLKDAAFMTLATLIIGGSGLGAAVAFLFGGNKSSSDAMNVQTRTDANK